MADEWRSSNWGDEVTLEYGKAIRGYSPFQGKYRVFGSNGPIGWTSQALAQGPGVILGRKGAYRGAEYWREPFWVIDTAYYLVPKTELDMRWLYYAVKHYKLGEIDDGSPIPSTTRAAVYMLEINVPPQSEQRAIAHILGTLDDKIELNRRRNQTLEAMARALFQDWFVDFGPVRAKLEGREPYFPADLWQIFPERFDDEGNPQGWEKRPLADLCTLGRGASPRPINDFMNGEIPWVKIADATAADGPFLFETKERVTTKGAEKSVAVVPGDLILSNSATCGVPMFVELNGCIHDGWLYFKNLEVISKIYLFHVLVELAEHLVQIADGSVQKNLNTKLVGQQSVLVPKREIVDYFNTLANGWFEKIRQNTLESCALAQLRDTLLPKLISGELRIVDVDRWIANRGDVEIK